MPTPTKGHRLGGSPAHQRHMMANLATALFEHGKITTTEARARRLRPVADRLITFAKRGDLHARRQVLTMVTDRNGVHTLSAEIGPSFAAREGGYTRITRANSWCWSWAPGHGRPCKAHGCAAPSLPKRQAATRPGVSDPRLHNVADMLQKRLAATSPRRHSRHVAPPIAGTSATRADRQHRPRAALGPSCRSSAPNTGLRQPHEQTAWTPPWPTSRIVVRWSTAIGPYRCTTVQLIVRVTPSRAWTREATSLPSSSMSRASARAMTS